MEKTHVVLIPDWSIGYTDGVETFLKIDCFCLLHRHCFYLRWLHLLEINWWLYFFMTLRTFLYFLLNHFIFLFPFLLFNFTQPYLLNLGRQSNSQSLIFYRRKCHLWLLFFDFWTHNTFFLIIFFDSNNSFEDRIFAMRSHFRILVQNILLTCYSIVELQFKRSSFWWFVCQFDSNFSYRIRCNEIVSALQGNNSFLVGFYLN